ncbi:MAG TPA: efflux RND transporter permease subunit, partial [Candidatus Limnocylindria bacterium]
TILALVPLAAGFNQGSIIAAELGTVVIGGLLSSTFLTLLVIPVVYSLVDGLRTRINRRMATSSADAVESSQAAPAS